MRGNWKSVGFGLLLIGSALAAAPALAAPACGPLAIITPLDLVTVSGGRPGVEAMIADKPVTLLIDTGSPVSMLTRQVTRELGLPVGQASLEVRNVAGRRSAEQARLPSITLGRFRQEGVYFFVDPADRSTERGSFDGIIGTDFLYNVDADFDFSVKKLNLISPNHCAGKVVYWAAPKLATIPFRYDRSAHITFPLRLDDKRVTAMLDTGAYNTTLNLNVARRSFDVDVNAPDVQKIGELQGSYTANIYRKQFKTITLDGVVVNNPNIDLLPDMMSNPSAAAPDPGSLIRNTDANPPDLILGMNVLSKLHVYVAYKEAKLYITAAGDQPVPGAPAQ